VDKERTMSLSDWHQEGYVLSQKICTSQLFRVRGQMAKPGSPGKWRLNEYVFVWYYAVSQKKGATLTMAITLSILGGFTKFFHCCKEQ